MTRVRLSQPVVPGQRVAVPEGQARHLVSVLRLRVGAPLEVVDGDERRWEGGLAGIGPAVVEIVREARGPDPTPAVDLEVWIPLLKGGRSDDVVRQLTEIGARRIVPYVAARTVVRPDARKADKRLRRWRTIAEEATRQCGRPDMPEVLPIRRLPDDGPGVVFWEEEAPRAAEVLCEAAVDGRLRVLVGPEGGLEEGEVARLRDRGWQPAWLGPRILRAETAVLVAATLAMHALGEGGY
ncbi:MAG: RsmE family RNA methyltransferase [Myxococcota bacterium]